MPTKTIVDGPEYILTQTDELSASVPYQPQDRPDGNRNYGFRDLRDHPELVGEIPEAKNSPGMQAILKALNSPDSLLMSIGCERATYPNPNLTDDQRLSFVVVSYIHVAYRDPAQNVPDNFKELAKVISDGMKGSGGHLYSVAFTIEPLRSFFGDQGRFALAVKPTAYGRSPAVAEAAWEYAAQKLAEAITSVDAIHKK